MPTRLALRRPATRWRVYTPLCFVVAALIIAACGGSSGETTATSVTSSQGPDTPTDPDAVIAQIVTATDALESFRFHLEPQGVPIAIDAAGMIVVESADGAVRRPNASQALVTVVVSDNRLEMGLISIGDQLWMQDPLTRQWRDAAGMIPFNPGTLFSPTTGLTAVLTDQLQEPTLAFEGGEPVLRGDLSGETMASLTGGILDQTAQLELQYDPEHFVLQEATLGVTTGDGESVWHIELRDVGAAIDIAPPAID